MQEFLALFVATTEDLGADQVDDAEAAGEQEGPLALSDAREYHPFSSSSDDVN
jgi:hypothetical protein